MTESHLNPRFYRFGMLPVLTGTAATGTVSQITLTSAATAVDDELNRSFVVITVQGAGDPPVGEVREIATYNHTTKVATVVTPFSAAPDSGSCQWAVYSRLRTSLYAGFALAGGTPGSIVLADTEPAIDGFFEGCDLMITHGPIAGGRNGEKKYRVIQYTGSTRAALVDRAFDGSPVATSKYAIQGHLYHPLTKLEIKDKDGKLIRFANPATPGAIGLGAYSTGDLLSEQVLQGAMDIDIAMDSLSGTLEIARWE